MCDPAPFVALAWLGAFSLVGSGFGLYALYRAEAQGRGRFVSVLAAVLNLSGLFVCLRLLIR
jgi:hypothetical protein